jgi:hypothetical protein
MIRYTELIKNLLSEDAYTIGEDTYLLTLYIDTYASDRSGIETKVKSFLKKGFLENKLLKDVNTLRNSIWDSIFQELNSIEYFKRGIAIFVKFTTKNRGNIDIQIADLYMQPETEVYLGQEYDLDQLMWIDSMTKNSIVVNLAFNNANIYCLQGEEFDLVDSVKFELEKDFKEYLQKYSPMKSGGTMYHGTGEVNKERQKVSFLKNFLSEVMQIVKKDYLRGENIDYVVIYHSSSFDSLSKDIEKETKVVIGLEPIILSKNVEEESVLKKETDLAVRNAERVFKRERLELAKNNRNLYAEGWNEVCYTSRTGRIEELFMLLNSSQEGYLGEDGFVYTNSVENGQKINNIAPRLIKNTLEHGGKVYLFMEGDELLEECVAAKLRF